MRDGQSGDGGDSVRKNKKTRPPRGVMQVGAEAMIDDPAPGPGEKDEQAVEETTTNPAPAERRSGIDIVVGDDEMIGAALAGAADEAAPRREHEPDPAREPAPKAEAEAKPELETLRDERDAYLDLARRERADFDNYRKRMQREMAEMKRASLAAFLKEFFGPLDDMDRVLRESAKNQSFESLAQGVRIMEENFWRVLAKAGVRRIDAQGKPFDPNLHEAMAAVPAPGVPPNTVLEVYDNGYKLDDFILRPAKVVVSRAPDE